MKIKKFKTEEDAATEAAKEVIALTLEKPDLILGLDTGESLRPFYKELVKPQNRELFGRIKTFQTKSYIGLTGCHPMNHRYFLTDAFLDHIRAVPRYQRRLSGLPVDVKAYCKKFEGYIRKEGGLDIIVLSPGPEGSLAFNEDSSLNSVARKVRLSEKLRNYYQKDFVRGKVPKWGLTMGMNIISKAKRIIIVNVGEDKKKAMKIETPLMALLNKHPDITIHATIH